MPPAVHMVCEIDKNLLDEYPLDTLPWAPNANGICGMIESPPMVEDFFALVKPYFNGAALGMNMVSKVIRGQAIQIHSDRHDGVCKTRVHIPLKTNENAYFYTGGSFHHMEQGRAYLIDPSEEHGVVNLGVEDRIHLIFNMVK